MASDVVRWMIGALKLSNEGEAVSLMNKLIEKGLVQHVSSPSKGFKNSNSSMYRIIEAGARSSPKDSKGKLYPDPLLPRTTKNISFADVDPLEIARQLYDSSQSYWVYLMLYCSTLIEFKMYKKIELAELTSQIWNKGGGANVVKMIDRSNDVCNAILCNFVHWITHSI